MHGDKKETMEDAIAVELPLTFVIDGEEFATMVCSPTHVEELAIGFLASEGLIRTMEDLADLQLDLRRGFIYVELRVTSSIHKDQVNKRFIGSCCGKSRQFYFHNDMRTAKTIMSDHKLEAKRCWLMMHELEDASSSFKRTGGMHNAALFDHERLLVARTDIGRHNALDKLFGYCLQQRLPVNDKILAFSGRVSSEVLLKAAKIGIGIVLSKSAPTSLALELARDLGITVVGFIRRDSMNVYTHSQRIVSNGSL